MHKAAPAHDQGDEDLEVRQPDDHAAGVPAVLVSLRDSVRQMGVGRTVSSLRRLNQHDGFDCPGCAWPDPAPGHRSPAEFCENGAKAVAEEATRRTVGADFLARHPLSDLAGRSDHWLGQQGRLTTPAVRRPGSDRYEAVGWDEAYDVVAAELAALADPDEAIFYTSGRTSNEAAFAYQLLARAFGTNNLPDCSNMCHESSGAALNETIGVGKGTVLLDDVEDTDLIIIVGQNPGTNHPRMLTSLEKAKEGGARIVAVNPLPEAGLRRFKNPQRPSGVVGPGTDLADRLLQIRVNGDLALFQALGARLLAADEAAGGATAAEPVLDHDFIATHTDGFEDYAAHLAALDPDEVAAATGLTPGEIDGLVDEVVAADRIIVCWAMGLTQHRNSVATIREVVNFLLLRGNIGRQGAGACPVRGHSNVQGDRTMGIWEKMPDAFLDRLAEEFSFSPPRHHGHDTVASIRAMAAGEARAFVGMGGNIVAAGPDTEATAAALAGCRLTVQVSTKLNRSHTVPGEVGVILPCKGRTDLDVQAGGLQQVSVEDSMGEVHASRGHLEPPAPDLPSEVEVISQVARRLVADRAAVDWEGLQADYGRIRDHIGHVVPGFEDYDARVGDGFTLPNPARDSRTFRTETGRARFTVNDLTWVAVPEGHLLLQTLRSHDQYNTTIYGLDDRYRGIHQGRRVVFVHPADLSDLGRADGDVVDVVSVWDDGERRAPAFRLVAYPVARGTAAAYFPEANVLVPLESTAEVSGTPTSKSLVVRFEPT
ncbi:FdhF/YdeP family oxidoreductase [Iamia majanohamensis]|uniref:FdhF/YdeP family oxidoreductase n=1 Tax=Iamia majanohamensis TaxID=467976 RepID=A0AAF0BT86_9ACTN|nr:FdhF/YdeP family oxidoreductase [Iamia majanohamensis]WCO66472.1 FdhF/YdeP family oxidoreductase [Iamia majanohamensis]